MEQNLRDVGEQNVIAVNNAMHGYHMMLEGLIAEVQNRSDRIEDTMSSFKHMADKYGLVRISYANRGGWNYDSNGTASNVKTKQFYQDGMNGKPCITNVLREVAGGAYKEVNIVSMPIKDINDYNEVSGVMSITFETSNLTSRLDLTSFNDQGYSFVVDSQGCVLTSGKNELLEVGRNLTNEILTDDSRNNSIRMDIMDSIRKHEDYLGKCYLGDELMLYGKPVDLLNDQVTWYVFTAVKSSYLVDRQKAILRDLRNLIDIIIMLLSIGIAVIIIGEMRSIRQINRVAYIDPLTGGDNLARFKRRAKKIKNKPGYLISMDIADFKFVNDAMGTAEGDEILKDIWKAISLEINNIGIAAHISADNFVIFLNGQDMTVLDNTITNINEVILSIFNRKNCPKLNSYFGVYPTNNIENFDQAYSNANIAKSKVKKKSDVFYALYDAEDHKKKIESNRITSEFKQVLKEHRMEVWFQPKYAADGKKIVGAEALARWRNADGSLTSPGVFIPLLEANGMIVRMDEYMFTNVCALQRKWINQGVDIVPVSVNLSRVSLYYDNVVEKYIDIINKYAVPIDKVQIEITESALSEREDMTELLNGFRRAGFVILMDDFGSGYSSLATLNTQCFDTLKIDKSLTDGIGQKAGETIFTNTVTMAKQLGLHITVEGVETNDQLSFIQKLECDDIQGYLFAKPMTADEYLECL